MTTTAYAMVRGSAIRVTALGRLGEIPDPSIRFATSKSVAQITVNEMSESGSDELIRNDEDEPRLRFAKSGETIRHTVDVDFLRCDPGVLSIVAGTPMRVNAAGDIVGFDANTKQVIAAAFALEVWTRLAGQRCANGAPAWGYTLFPFIKGGYVTGTKFSNGAVSFNLRGAQTRRMPRWGVGPFDLEGPQQRHIEMVSRNTSFRQMLTSAAPPAQVDGEQTTTDIIDGGSAAVTTEDVIDGGIAISTSDWIIYGGRAV